MINPLSPKFYIHIQILQTDLHTFPLRISSENVIKDHRIFPLVIILLILVTLSLDNVWILLGENCFWSYHSIMSSLLRQSSPQATKSSSSTDKH